MTPLAAAVAAMLAGGAAPGAFAQDAAPVEEILVTASRRETTLQELPFNIAALSGDTLARQRLTNLTEFSRWVPGLTVVDQGSRSPDLMTVRGLNVLSLNDSQFLGNTSGDTVATYLGEIPLYIDFRMKDVERVEVLLGPQGTLYGAGTLGGAVRYIPSAPDTRAWELAAHGDLYSLAHSNGAGYDADMVVNVPIVEDTLAFRASVGYYDDPGFIDYPFVLREPGVSDPEPDLADPADVGANLRRVEDADWEQTTSGRLALLWQASENVRATFNYYFQDQEVGARTVNHRHAFGTGPYESAHRFLEPNDRENSLFSAEVVADLGFAELTSATGVAEYDQVGQRDQTDLLLAFEYGYETFPAFSAFTRDASHEERFSQELRLVSQSDGPWGWIAGLYHNDFELDATSDEYTPGFPAFFGVSLPTGDLEYTQYARQRLTEQALFGEVSRQITRRLEVALGGRWFRFEDDSFFTWELPFVPAGDARGNVADDDGFLGKINASYAFSEDVLGYVTLSEGYRIGGVNPVPSCPDPLPAGQIVCALPHEVLFDPDQTTNLEVGMHSVLGESGLSLDVAVYTMDWDDIQTVTVTENGSLPIKTNGGGARSRGVELALRGRLAQHWSFSAGYAYNNAELTEDAPGLVDGEDAFAGDRLAGTPEHQGSFYVAYTRPLAGGWALDASYGFTVTSDVLTKVGLRADGETLSGYTVHNASLGLSKDRWSATLYADNLTDKFAETAVRLDPTHVYDVNGFRLRRYFRNVLRPRSVGVEFRYRFGD
ncbi:MAG TPA: TonB-dependent receptor [Gammaproteobacteria bacterium]